MPKDRTGFVIINRLINIPEINWHFSSDTHVHKLVAHRLRSSMFMFARAVYLLCKTRAKYDDAIACTYSNQS